MRIIEEYDALKEDDIVEIISAKYTGDYSIKIIFSDKSEKIVNFKTFLTNSIHPSIKKYLDEKLFLQYQIVDGNLNWNDYDLIFPLKNLYEGSI